MKISIDKWEITFSSRYQFLYTLYLTWTGLSLRWVGEQRYRMGCYVNTAFAQAISDLLTLLKMRHIKVDVFDEALLCREYFQVIKTKQLWAAVSIAESVQLRTKKVWLILGSYGKTKASTALESFYVWSRFLPQLQNWSLKIDLTSKITLRILAGSSNGSKKLRIFKAKDWKCWQ